MSAWRIQDVCIAATLFAANLLILGPWLLTDFPTSPGTTATSTWRSREMFRDRKWTWNPLQYAGAPFHYLYPPIFHVLIGAMPVRSIGLAFHLVTGIGYALVPVALYVLGRQLFGGQASRRLRGDRLQRVSFACVFFCRMANSDAALTCTLRGVSWRWLVTTKLRMLSRCRSCCSPSQLPGATAG